ncbi:MotA/TolQ/ExbB proton channel family protein [Anaeroglobus geminatus]|uniref:Transporter, MotA/TolQ/ExbB proton channel family protein n=1 Tax=Anaeroglobus geminatus F0357 TaxID=861450 RepID=G9YFG3_9FIRM|nr:MotA/TolQ/ExbB proton channel family protein [Anaeroglobus geminatus]EHM43130.1 transporter, MotA/TolQ/ExbB proton channel family protein [Anaeroglobus geminatus F0357]
MNGLELFEKGGFIMYVLVLCSLGVVTIAAERLNFYRRLSRGMEQFSARLPIALRNNGWESTLEDCEESDNAVAFLAAAGIKEALRGGDVTLALDTAYNEVAGHLRAHLNYLGMIVTLSPLLGLLGTISGMISSFNVFSMQAGEPLAITGGIGEALIATATGLCVAIMALIIHTFLAQRLDEILSVLDKASSAVLAECGKNGERR